MSGVGQDKIDGRWGRAAAGYRGSRRNECCDRSALPVKPEMLTKPWLVSCFTRLTARQADHPCTVQATASISCRSFSIERQFYPDRPAVHTRYKSRDGRGVPNDDNDAWLKPAFAEMYRSFERTAFCVSFYAMNKADLFIRRLAQGRFPYGHHLVFPSVTHHRLASYAYLSTRLRICSQRRRDAAGVTGAGCARLGLYRHRLHPTQIDLLS